MCECFDAEPILHPWRFINHHLGNGPRDSSLVRCSRSTVYFGAYFIIDPSYALSIVRIEGDADVDPLWYYLGVATPLLPAWVGSTAVGAVAGSTIPTWLPLDFAVPMVFLALVVPTVSDRPAAVAAATGATVAVLGTGLPLNLGLLAGGLVGVAAGMAVEWREDA